MVKREVTMVPFERAVRLVEGMRQAFYGELEREKIPVPLSPGRRLAADVRAVARSPEHNISTMDGYAVDTGDGYPLRLTKEVFAGDLRTRPLGKGEACYVATGAAVPGGADAVLRIEDAVVQGGSLFSGVELAPGTNIIEAGADFEAGERILEKDAVVGPAAMCILSAAAVGEVSVYRRIRAGVISTGNEIKSGMVRNCNAPMVCAMLRAWGCEAEHLGVVSDSASETVAALDAAAGRFDAVVTIGGVSVGKKDFIGTTILEKGDVVFHGYRIRPGKPLLVSYYRGKPVFSLPGKPTGAFTAMELIVKRFILGATHNASMVARISDDVELKGEDFDYVVYVQIKDGTAVPMGYEDSPLKLFTGPRYGVSIVSASPRALVADGYVRTRESLKAGQAVTVIFPD